MGKLSLVGHNLEIGVQNLSQIIIEQKSMYEVVLWSASDHLQNQVAYLAET